MHVNDPNEALTNGITAAMRRGVARARALHGALGLPIAIWRDGRVEHVDPISLRAIEWPENLREGENAPWPPRTSP